MHLIALVLYGRGICNNHEQKNYYSSCVKITLLYIPADVLTGEQEPILDADDVIRIRCYSIS